MKNEKCKMKKEAREVAEHSAGFAARFSIFHFQFSISPAGGGDVR
jgi:hypothetical protein